MKKKLLIKIMAVVFVMMSIPLVSTMETRASLSDKQDKVEQCIYKFFDRYYQSLSKGNMVEFDDLLADNKNVNIFKKFILWDSYSNKTLNMQYVDYSIDFEVKNMQETAEKQ